MDIFEEIADERRRLATQLASLSPAQQQAHSLCHAWNVHEVVAHLVMPMKTPLYRFAIAMLASGGNFDRANQKLAQKLARRPFAELLEILSTQADNRFTPPGEGPLAPLTDVIVHGLDIRWPLRVPDRVPEQRLRLVLDFLTTSPKAFVADGLLDGIALRATNLDWSYGDGAAVSGSAEALLLALTGRPAGLSELQGEGVEILAARGKN